MTHQAYQNAAIRIAKGGAQPMDRAIVEAYDLAHKSFMAPISVASQSAKR